MSTNIKRKNMNQKNSRTAPSLVGNSPYKLHFHCPFYYFMTCALFFISLSLSNLTREIHAKVLTKVACNFENLTGVAFHHPKKYLRADGAVVGRSSA